jgi:hypothetical protein
MAMATIQHLMDYRSIENLKGLRRDVTVVTEIPILPPAAFHVETHKIIPVPESSHDARRPGIRSLMDRT